MKYILTAMVLTWSLCASAAFKTIAQCAVENVVGWEGARVNLKSDGTNLKANFIQGTTISGTMYHVTQTSPGVFKGSIKGDASNTILLKISKTPGANRSINGHAASLEITYPSSQVARGYKNLKTTPSDNFVCGKKFADF